MYSKRRVLLALVFFAVTTLFIVSFALEHRVSPDPMPPSALDFAASEVATPDAAVLHLPIVCRTPIQSAATRGSRPQAAGGLESQPWFCGCAHVIGVRDRASWHGHIIVHGLKLTGRCPGVVLRLNGQYQELVGHVYLDDSTGTVGGMVDFYDAVTPSRVATYRQLFDNNIGLTPNHTVPVRFNVAQLHYLAIVERCCTVQNTVVDVTGRLLPKPRVGDGSGSS